MSAWSEYKEKLGNTKPRNVVNPTAARSSTEVADARYEICLGCDRLSPVTRQCAECRCFMVVKTRFAVAVCPLGKW